ncbi:MAG: ABC transporter permease [Paracoccaceae bacterium]
MEASGGLSQTEQENILLASVVDKARRQIGLFLGILLAVSAVVIALIIYMTMEKLKQIATLKLISAPDRTIIGLIVQQSLILGTAGWGIGLVPDPADQGCLSAPCGAGGRSTWPFWPGSFRRGLSGRQRSGRARGPKVDPATALGELSHGYR